MENNLFQDLFQALPEDNAEQLWFDQVEEYLAVGGDKLITNPSNGWGLLHYAAENIFKSVVEMLLDNGVPVDINTTNGSTPYLVALDSAIDAAIQNDDPDFDFSVVKLLIQSGANTEACSNDGISKDSILENYGEKATEEYYKQFP